MKEAQSAIQEGILQPFQCQINRGIKASSAYGDLTLEDARNLVDGKQNPNFVTQLTGENGEPSWFKIDLGLYPCHITQIQISGFREEKTGFINV